MIRFLRLPAVLVAGLTAVACGWVLQGEPAWIAGGLAALDWGLFGLLNRISDVPEDERNGVPGAGFARQNASKLMRATFLALAVSLIGARPLGTPLLVLRLAFHAGGFAYSFPTLTRRFKEVFLVKNLVPAVLFAGAVAGYPLALAGRAPDLHALTLVALLLPAAIACELIGDLRDVAGDQAGGIPTLPIRWGAGRTRALIAALFALSLAAAAALRTGRWPR